MMLVVGVERPSFAVKSFVNYLYLERLLQKDQSKRKLLYHIVRNAICMQSIHIKKKTRIQFESFNSIITIFLCFSIVFFFNS